MGGEEEGQMHLHGSFLVRSRRTASPILRSFAEASFAAPQIKLFKGKTGRDTHSHILAQWFCRARHSRMGEERMPIMPQTSCFRFDGDAFSSPLSHSATYWLWRRLKAREQQVLSFFSLLDLKLGQNVV